MNAIVKKPVGYLPREISRISKFTIERGAIADVELTSDHYRRSPLVQGGLEIKRKVTVKVSYATATQVTGITYDNLQNVWDIL